MADKIVTIVWKIACLAGRGLRQAPGGGHRSKTPYQRTIWYLDDRKGIELKSDEDLLVPVVMNEIRAKLTPHYTIIREPGDPPVSFEGSKINFLISANDMDNPKTVLDFAATEAQRNRFLESGTYTLDYEGLQISTDQQHWLCLSEMKLELNVTATHKFRYCKPSDYQALKNHSTGDLSITDLRIDLPPFVNSEEWEDVDAPDLSGMATELVPVIGISLSQLALSSVGLDVRSTEGS